MADLSITLGASSALTVTGLSTLASANYATSNAISCTTRSQTNFEVECEIGVGTVASDKQIVVFAIGSDDGTNYETQNTNATDTTHDANMRWVATIPTPANSETVKAKFTVAQAFNYVLPADSFKLVFKNTTGAALTSATVNTRAVTISAA